MKLFRKKPESAPRIVGVFAYVDDLVLAIRSAKESGLAIDTVYTPVRIEEVSDALGARPSPVRYFALFGAITGIVLGVGLSIYTVLQWKFLVSGKPIIPLVPFVIAGFEFLILIGVLFNLLGVVIMTRLPRFKLPKWYDIRFSGDRFGLVIKCGPDQKENISTLMKQSGAESIHEYGP